MMIYIIVTVTIQNSVTETMIITGDLLLIKNQKLRKLFTEGSNFRETQSLNYPRCKKEIDRAIEKFASILRLKHKLGDTPMDAWVNKVRERVKNEIKSLKKLKQIYITNPVLQDEEVR